MNSVALPKSKAAVLTSPEELLSLFALALIAVYKSVLSPLLLSTWGPACRFEPTCSAYAAEAIRRYGIRRGGWMGLERLMKCRPMGGWGFDPLPGIHYISDIKTASAETRHHKRGVVG
jgi:uncharacterized protein